MSSLTRSKSAPAPAAPATAAPAPAEVSHAMLRALPVGFDDPSSSRFVAPELRAFYAADAGDFRVMHSLDASAGDVASPTRRRDDIVHGYLLERAQHCLEGQAASRRWELDNLERNHRCEVCGHTDPARGLDNYRIVDGTEVVRTGFGIVGREIRCHPACAAALGRELVARVDPATVRAFAANVTTT